MLIESFSLFSFIIYFIHLFFFWQQALFVRWIQGAMIVMESTIYLVLARNQFKVHNLLRI